MTVVDLDLDTKDQRFPTILAYKGIITMMVSFMILLALFSADCSAENLSLEIPDHAWKVKFSGPSITKVKEMNTPSYYYYLGKADRFSLSLFVESPTCPGVISVEDNQKCILPKIEQIPGFQKQSLTINTLAKGIQIIYVAYAPMGDKAVKIMHTHILFANRGKWGDLHASIIQPTIEDIAQILRFGEGFDYSE